MNSFSTFGIFVVLLFAYCTPTQGQTIAVSDVAFENGKRYKSTSLIKLSNGTYKIEAEAPFGIEGIDTIAGNDVVLRTKDNSYIQMRLVNSQDSLQLFNTTTRPKLGQSLYSFKVSVYKYKEGLVSDDLFLTGFEYSTTGKPQPRFVIHSGEALSTEMKPLLLWTAEQFHGHAWYKSFILTVRTKPADKTNECYLVNFDNVDDQHDWIYKRSLAYNREIGPPPNDSYSHFYDYMTAYQRK